MKQQLFQSKRGARTSPAAGRTLPAVPVSWLCSGWQLLAASPGWQRLLSEQLGCGGSCSTEEVVTEELREPTTGHLQRHPSSDSGCSAQPRRSASGMPLGETRVHVGAWALPCDTKDLLLLRRQFSPCT